MRRRTTVEGKQFIVVLEKWAWHMFRSLLNKAVITEPAM